jgi:hypothetical protein
MSNYLVSNLQNFVVKIFLMFLKLWHTIIIFYFHLESSGNSVRTILLICILYKAVLRTHFYMNRSQLTLAPNRAAKRIIVTCQWSTNNSKHQIQIRKDGILYTSHSSLRVQLITSALRSRVSTHNSTVLLFY